VIRSCAFTLVYFASTESNAQSFAEQRDRLIDAFLAETAFSVVQRLDELPRDVQDLLERHSDGTFAIAERGEPWNMTDLINPAEKSASHIISGVSSELAVVLLHAGGIGVSARIRIYDRRRGAGISCVASRLAREWNGSNHTRELIPPGFASSEPLCWSVPVTPTDGESPAAQ
jgi:hypothetical protein